MSTSSTPKSTFILAIAMLLFVSVPSLRADDQASPTPQNRNELKMDRDSTQPKANVVKVKPIPGGPQNGHAGLDPNANGSTAGIGVQIPLGRPDGSAGNSAPSKKDDADSRDSE
jgi:hypothetical protein